MGQKFVTTSGLARQLDRPRADVVRRASELPWGVCVHTTGSGVTARAQRQQAKPVDVALAIYLAPDDPTDGIYTPFPHYVIGWDGRADLVQVCDEALRARHCQITAADRESYLSGAWREHVSPEGLIFWQQRWPEVPSPSHLYPGPSANEQYIGIELIPTATPDAAGSLFTPAQYEALGELLEDIENRYQQQLGGTRLVGHEDLSPLSRWNSAGGWDPGALNEHPSFRWDSVRRHTGWSFTGLAPVGALPERPIS